MLEARQREAIRRALRARSPRGAGATPEREGAAARLLLEARGRARSVDDPEYPARIRSLSSPPQTLFLAGPWDHDGPVVAIVGSRSGTGDGCDVARALAADLASAGIAIVSGLAKGIDAAAHEGALDAGGRSGAVLGTGLERCFPRGHERLQRALRESLGLLSEVVPGEAPRRATFATRNRILAALADAVIVVQGDRGSGSLLTADAATDLGRPIGAVPWDPREALAAAPHELIRNGRATLVRDAADVLALLATAPLARGAEARLRAIPGAPAFAPGAPPPVGTADGAAARVLAALRYRGEPLDDVAHRAGLPVPDVAAALLALELEGRARREAGGRYARVRAG